MSDSAYTTDQPVEAPSKHAYNRTIGRGGSLNPVTLAEVGEACWGPRWQTNMANELGIADRTVRRWACGQFYIPDVMIERLATICARRASALRRAQSTLQGLTSKLRA